MATTVTGTAFMTSGNTNITTVIVETFDGFDLKYRYLAIQGYECLDEETDAKRTAQWGNTLDSTIGYAIIFKLGSKVRYEVS